MAHGSSCDCMLCNVGKKIGLIKKNEGVEQSTPEVGGDVGATTEGVQGESSHGESNTEDASSKESTPPTNM